MQYETVYEDAHIAVSIPLAFTQSKIVSIVLVENAVMIAMPIDEFLKVIDSIRAFTKSDAMTTQRSGKDEDTYDNMIIEYYESRYVFRKISK